MLVGTLKKSLPSMISMTYKYNCDKILIGSDYFTYYAIIVNCKDSIILYKILYTERVHTYYIVI